MTLQRHLEEAAFWEIPTKLKDDGDTDGAQLIVEGAKGGAITWLIAGSPAPPTRGSAGTCSG